jgi:hypothetical protein
LPKIQTPIAKRKRKTGFTKQNQVIENGRKKLHNVKKACILSSYKHEKEGFILPFTFFAV